MIKMRSVCGATYGYLDIEDFWLNPHGVRCCDACVSIVESRESWADFYNYDFTTGLVIA